MRLKLDENLGPSSVARLREAGHDVMGVLDQGLSGAADGVLFEACQSEGRALVTLDLDFANPFRFSPTHAAGLAVLRVPSRPSQMTWVDAPALASRAAISVRSSRPSEATSSLVASSRNPGGGQHLQDRPGHSSSVNNLQGFGYHHVWSIGSRSGNECSTGRINAAQADGMARAAGLEGTAVGSSPAKPSRSGEYCRGARFDATVPFIALILTPRLRASADPRAVRSARDGEIVVRVAGRGLSLPVTHDGEARVHERAAGPEHSRRSLHTGVEALMEGIEPDGHGRSRLPRAVNGGDHRRRCDREEPRCLGGRPGRRRTTEGKTGKEIIRCLKRYVAREVYQAITNPPDDLPTGAELRQLRQYQGLDLTVVCNAVGTTPIRLSTLERGLVHDTRLARRCRTWLLERGA